MPATLNARQNCFRLYKCDFAVSLPQASTLLPRTIRSIRRWRQLLHMACHAENIQLIIDARVRRGLFLDRWWWSTIAYGWYRGGLARSGIKKSVFFGLIESVWSAQQADVIFLFMTPHESDKLNSDEVRSGYAALAAEHEAITVGVPSASPDETTDFILATLRARELLA